MRVCVIGKGVIGSNIAKQMKDKGIDEIWTIDINPETKPDFNSLKQFYMLEEEPADVYIICVWTSDQVLEIASQIKLDNDPLISIETAGEIGTYQKVKDIIGRRSGLIVFNERWNPQDFYHDLWNQNRVMGGDCKRGIEFYSQYMLRENIITTPSGKMAELCKVTENAYRYLEIAIAQELKMVVGEEFEHLRELINSKWNINILEARDGIGGPCLPKDIKLFNKAFPKNTLFKEAEKSNKKYMEKKNEFHNISD